LLSLAFEVDAGALFISPLRRHYATFFAIIAADAAFSFF
jgi:hypothetical protein